MRKRENENEKSSLFMCVQWKLNIEKGAERYILADATVCVWKFHTECGDEERFYGLLIEALFNLTQKRVFKSTD